MRISASLHNHTLFTISLFLCSLHLSSSSDPVEQFFRNVALAVRQVGEKMLSTIHIPNMQDLNNNNNVMFNMDEKTVNAVDSLSEFFNTCPPAISPNLGGNWNIQLISKRMLQGIFQDVDEVISRLLIQQPLESRKTIGSLFRAEVDIQCASLVVLNSTVDSSFEFSYSVSNQPRSIIGQLHINNDRTITMAFAPTLTLHLSTIYSSQIGLQSSTDTVVMAQVDTFPKCDNLFVLSRQRTADRTIFDQLTQIGHNYPSNPLINVQCTTNSVT